ncbi:hypothetical protein [Gimesia sp.]|uniref:hypothetical protein n=1 Tax=Gimesia sp. TaxID=2024833 RepID=UPI000C673E19|nr:hypothetical protein [Gimesia sp.]MAX37479.1 hypothetical protein [Gimesia sp.]HBL46004.1 hypothetical protein [Planctomycetaceae bacterium]|tara:strand:+ start:8296 stop:8628 length:333 start_codon:yes stop_codon:yes gene_type:complete
MRIPHHLFLLSALCLLYTGCAEERPFVPQPSAEYVVVLDEKGKPDNILLEQFFKKQDHLAGVKILVIDKQSKGHALITPAELLKQNPNAGRYLIFKHDDPERPFDDLPQQ